MNKALSTVLICLLLIFGASDAKQVIRVPSVEAGNLIVKRTTDVPGGGQSYKDDFSSDPTSTWITNSGTTPTYLSEQEDILFEQPGVFLYPLQTDTIYQWVLFRYTSAPSSSYAGNYFNSQNDISKYAYTVRSNQGSTFVWRYCLGHTCTDVSGASWSRTITNNDFIGITREGTGTNTVITVYDFGVFTPNNCVTALECNPDNVDWDLYDEANNVFTNDPPSQAYQDADSPSSRFCGLYSGGSANQRLDDFYCGDWSP